MMSVAPWRSSGQDDQAGQELDGAVHVTDHGAELI